MSTKPTHKELIELLRPITAEYSPPITPELAGETFYEAFLARFAFDMKLVTDEQGTDISVVDLAGGIGLFSLGFAKLGARSVIVDDWGDDIELYDRGPLFAMFSRHGVEVVERDVLKEPFGLAEASFDAATSFHFLEHAYHSPKRAFHELGAALKPGGTLVIAGPNSVNLRKRITMPFGGYVWSPMDSWYDSENFRGHVREPSVKDLEYIARDLQMSRWTVLGTNYMGLAHGGWMARVTSAVDAWMRRHPSLCSEIYVVAER
jgi:SAM-dependent methyltransferase